MASVSQLYQQGRQILPKSYIPFSWFSVAPQALAVSRVSTSQPDRQERESLQLVTIHKRKSLPRCHPEFFLRDRAFDSVSLMTGVKREGQTSGVSE